MYEGAKTLVNKAIDGVRGLFAPRTTASTPQLAKDAMWTDIQEKGRQKWSKELKRDLKKEGVISKNVRLIEQKTNEGCVFYSRLMVIEAKTGVPVDPDEAYQKGTKGGYVRDDYKVLDANKLASENGLSGEVLKPTVTGSRIELMQGMIDQFEKGNPVMILIGKSNGDFYHMEVAKGYDFDKNGDLRILLVDPGKQDDLYLDVNTMQPYKYNIIGEKSYSGAWEKNSWGVCVKTEERRKVYGFNYYGK